jgi:uncharacterized protein YdeI (YjbR/CyaY-like superfamily)
VILPCPKSKPPRSFKTSGAFEAWLSRNHTRETELWLKIHKKGSGLPTVTYAQALEVALCWGWIDGLKHAFDEHSFLQRFTPRKAKSKWSQINRELTASLVAAGRMTEHGQKHVDAAKADGRWENAYAGSRTMTLPDDLRCAILASPRATATLHGLSKQNQYALAYRVHSVKNPVVRAKKIATYVAMLERGESLYPQRPAKAR